ncbi:PLP-dependent aminotransferase family protein [Nocardia beijingensis]|uniref:aminotransferase-like domain-containing protein n=1 Tax=Nocardia beijingensis TaxID=95162 RepID=UPI002B4B58D5|nr:PLP-dependent aminotransferase family protein [Nocardia beijingensis]
MRLARSALHGSLEDPVLGSVTFLNEIMSRYPEAISFAPGAPHPEFFDNLDPQRHIERFLAHLQQDRGYSRERARLLLFEYGPSRGIINDIVAETLRRDEGIIADQSEIVITVGAQEALLLVLRALFTTPARAAVAVANPCYPGIVGAARLLDLPVVPIPESSNGIDIDRLAETCFAAAGSGRRIQLCYVAPDFANPGGSRMPVSARRRLIELADQADFLILEDNPYGFTALGHEVLPSLKALDTVGRVIHVGTFAKTCFPGARVGYVIAGQHVDGGRWLADEIAALKSMVTVNTAPLAQAIVGGMLLADGGTLAQQNRRKAVRYQRNLECLLTALDAGGHGWPTVEWNRPDGGFFVVMRLPVQADLALLERSASEYGVLWTPMDQFYLDGSGSRRLRLSCSYLDVADIRSGVTRLTAFIENEVLVREPLAPRREG